MVKYKQTIEVLKIMRNVDQIRNIGITAHVDHGKTTLSDSLLSAAGLLSEKLAGQALALDYLDVEQRRQMTVKAANVSLYHEYKGKSYVINLIDTPGHVDFQSKTLRAFRAIDGAIVVVDAVEGVMTQTEMYLRVALEERVRPVLFINKIDRLIKELKLSPSEIQQRLVQIVKDINTLIANYADKEFQRAWLLDPAKGQVAFGSARDRWGLTIPLAAQKGIKIGDIIDVYNRGKDAIAELQKVAPLHEAVLDMVVKFIPSPREAQKYRIPKIWHGDINSEIAKYMMECDPKSPLVFMVTDVKVDPHAGLVATGRIFSGTLRPGEEVYLVNAKTTQRILQVSLYMGPYREPADEIPAGNIGAVLGVDKARSGETIIGSTLKDVMVPFERMRMITESVVTVAIEPKNPQQLTKLIDALYKLHLEDPSLIVKINEETGEYLLSGVGTLHIEIALTLLKDLYGLDVVSSPPVIVYRETVKDESRIFEGKSPNKHNKFYISVRPLDETTIRLIQEGLVTEDMDPRERAKILREHANWDTDMARRILAIDENINVFVDMTTGVQYFREVRDTVIQGFRLAMREGPLAHEPVRGVLVILHDAVIHEDPAHRGPAQIYPAVRNAIFAGMLTSNPTLLEPILKLDIKTPMEYIGNISVVITKKRGKILDIQQSENLARILAEIPVSESFDLADMLRSATAGKAIWGQDFSRWTPVPDSMLMSLIASIRQRKGLKPEPPKPEDFISL
ncbi:MAG: elongation factor EF-2 [Desulfurococcaceae archaeon]|nr:elongation factor EF-2 [Desulfurococcaceae archaeon]